MEFLKVYKKVENKLTTKSSTSGELLEEEENLSLIEISDEIMDKFHSSSDVLYEILKRIPLDCLVSVCPQVCQDWQKLAYDSKLRLIHSLTNKVISGYFTQTFQGVIGFSHTFLPPVINNGNHPQLSPPIPSLDFLPTNTNIVASTTCGILCCRSGSYDEDSSNYYVCKPTTQEWEEIPNPTSKNGPLIRMTMVVKASPERVHYKILHLSPSNNGYRCEIFDSKKYSWKILDDIKLPPNVHLDYWCGVPVDGQILYSTDESILVFNIDKESWKFIDLPYTRLDINKNSISKIQIVNYEGKPALFITVNDYGYEWGDEFQDSRVPSKECTHELWVLEDECGFKKGKIWKKKYSINTGSKIVGNCYPSHMHSRDIVIMKKGDRYVWYNCTNNTYGNATEPMAWTAGQIFYFESDSSICGLYN